MKKFAGYYISRQVPTKLIYRIHRKRHQQQRITVPLVIKEFMWIIGNHCCKGTKILSEVEGNVSRFERSREPLM